MATSSPARTSIAASVLSCSLWGRAPRDGLILIVDINRFVHEHEKGIKFALFSMVFFRDPVSRVAQRLSIRAVGEKANVNTIRALSFVLILGVASALVLLILYFVN